MSYRESFAYCDNCRNSIADNDNLACQKCLDDCQREVERLEKMIAELYQQLKETQNAP